MEWLLVCGLVIVCTLFLHIGAANRHARSLKSEQVKDLLDKQTTNLKKKRQYPVHFDILAEEYLKQMESETVWTDNPELYDLLRYLAIYRVGEARFCEEEDLIDGPYRGLKVVRHHLWILPATK